MKRSLLYTKIAFEDKGQDFLYWIIDKVGKIIECTPFQASVWTKGVVRNFKTLNVGSFAKFAGNGVDIKIKYPIIGICRWFDDGSIVCKVDLNTEKPSELYDELIKTDFNTHNN